MNRDEMKPILYSYFRSSSAFRIRIALNLKGIACEYRYINLHPSASEQRSPEYLEVNPQGKVPFYVDRQVRLGQSTAILEYLEEAYPEVPLLPTDSGERAVVRNMVQLIACDIQPLNNVSVLSYLRAELNGGEDDIQKWYSHWVQLGFSALEKLLEQWSDQYCFGNKPSLADAYLVPQVWNAKRFNVPLEGFPRILQIYDRCLDIPAFFEAAPEQQADKYA